MKKQEVIVVVGAYTYEGACLSSLRVFSNPQGAKQYAKYLKENFGFDEVHTLVKEAV